MPLLSRRVWNRLILGMPLSLLAGFRDALPAAAAESSGVDLDELQEQLEFGLRAGRPYELEFLRRVVTLVKLDVLLVKLVLSTYRWALKKQLHPFPYFAQALRYRAAEIGVQL